MDVGWTIRRYRYGDDSEQRAPASYCWRVGGRLDSTFQHGFPRPSQAGGPDAQASLKVILATREVQTVNWFEEEVNPFFSAAETKHNKLSVEVDV